MGIAYKVKTILRLGRIPWLLWKRRMLHPFPLLSLNFEVTRRCNGRCVYCNIWKTQSDPALELGPDEIREHLGAREARNLLSKVSYVNITGGEPFLRDDLLEVCHALREICPKAHFGLVTNGLMPDRVEAMMKRIKEEIDPRTACGISIDGPPEIDAITRGSAEHYRLAWETAERLRRMGIPGAIGTTLNAINFPYILQWKEYVRSRGWELAVSIAATSDHFYANTGEAIPRPPLIFPILEEVYRDAPTAFQFNLDYLRKPRQLFPCFSGFNSLFLSVYGDVYPCIHLSECMGNIRREPFRAIWCGERAREIRRIIRDGKCYCWTACEAGNTLRTLIYPILLRKLLNKIKKG